MVIIKRKSGKILSQIQTIRLEDLVECIRLYGYKVDECSLDLNENALYIIVDDQDDHHDRVAAFSFDLDFKSEE